MAKINPFRPNSPINPGMFIGRISELDRLESHLLQARAGLPINFMVTGERGIGKSSLLNYMKHVAEGRIEVGQDEGVLNFLVLDLDIDPSSTQIGIIKKIEFLIDSKLGKTEKARSLIRSAWSFLQRVEAAGVKLGKNEEMPLDEVVFEQFSHAVAELAERVCGDDSESYFGAKYDGILLLMDEADNASDQLNLGTFLKLFAERLERRQCSRVVIGLAGLPELRMRLMDSHPSSVRLFDEITLNRLTDDEIENVVSRCLESAATSHNTHVTIDDDARAVLVNFSEGYPHFIQQFGYSAFAADSDNIISRDDVMKGAFGKNGAMEAIGDRYYRDNFYNKIQEEKYRQVLRIMAEKLDGWVTKADIRLRFKGNDSSLDNAIKALRDRKIIVSKEGAKGVYRLQQKGFALWIKIYTTSPQELEDGAVSATIEPGAEGEQPER